MNFSRPWFGNLVTGLYVLLAVAAIASSFPGSAAGSEGGTGAEGTAKEEEAYKPKTKAELRRALTRMQYQVTQEADTEKAFRNAYWDNKKEGVYHCIVCDKALFDSTTKFKSGTGWPSFWAPLSPNAIGTQTDWKLLYPRTEVHCKRCKAHLGHVFDDGPPPTGLRYCLNSASLRFEPAHDEDAEPAESED